MPTVRRVLVAPLVLLVLASSPAFADQRHIVDPSHLATIIEQRAATQDADRAAVRDALARPEIREAAAKLGIDLTRAADAVATASASDLARAADAARHINQELVGGASTVTISTTTIIIALLIVILIVLIAD